VKDNPLDLDFKPWTGPELREFRSSLWSTLEELRLHPKYPKTCPSTSDMATRLGVHPEQYRHWERIGVPPNGWSALIRVYRDEGGRDVSPMNCAIDSLDAIADVLGNYSELASALEVDRRTITKWRYSIGYVPGVQGYGRIVRMVFEDIVLPIERN
jgi:hypothetical protein